MSERYTYEVEYHGCVVVYDRQRHCEMHGYAAANELNRLAAEVETLRALLREALPFIPLYVGDDECALRDRIDAAITTSGETP